MIQPSRFQRLRLLILCIGLLSYASSTLSSSITPSPPKVAAEGWLLIDYASNTVLAEQNADTPMEPASLTKIMTAYVVFREINEGNITLEEKVLISKKAWKTPGSRMFIEVNDHVSIQELLQGLIIQSGNDAGVALAEHIAGTEETFAQLMNSHAKRLGMNKSHFINSTGLPDKDHYTTARDIAMVTRAIIKEFPEFYGWYSIKEYTYNKIKQNNRNQLLWRDSSVDGVKTGYTKAAGYCLVSSAKREDMRLISVVLGTASTRARASESIALLNYGFRFYETYRLFKANKVLKQERVWKGATQTLAIGIDQDLNVAIPRGQFKNIKSTLELQPSISAPITKGQRVGKIKVNLAGTGEIASIPLIALEDILEGGLLQQAKDSLLLYFE